MNNQPDDERAARIRQARQVLAGTDVVPPRDPLPFGTRDKHMSPRQRAYLVALAAVLAVAVLLFAIWGLAPASAAFFVLALGLLAAWHIFKPARGSPSAQMLLPTADR